MHITVEAPSRSDGRSLPSGIQRQQEEPPAVIGDQVSADSAQKSPLESSNSTISTDLPAQKPLIARAPFNGRNIPIEAPPRSWASSTYPGGIQRLETSGVKKQEESTESLQMHPEEEIQAKSSSGESQEKEEQNKEIVQTKLTVGAAGDKYEQEADSMAAKVMRMPDEAIQQPLQRQTGEDTEAVQMQPLVNSITPLVQRESGEEEEVQMKSEVQRASDKSSVASGSLESRLAGTKGGGSPLPDDVRSFMEARFKSDFSSVRVHTDSNAVQMNKELGAQAFAHGSDIYYGAGKSPGKNELTAHELTHTIQQTGGVQLNKSVLLKPKPEQEQNQPLQAKKLSSSTPEVIQNKPIGTAARIQALVSAAKQMPDHFMGQLSEELLGMNLTEPLPFERSKEDCAKCDTPATAKGGDATAKGGDDKAALLNKTKFSEDDFAIDSVAPFDVDPEFVASLNLQEGGEVEFGESNDPANSMEAIKAELAGGETEGDVPAGAVAEGEQAVGGCCDDEQTAEAKLQEMMAQKPEGAEATQKQGKPAQQGDIPASMKTIGPLSAGQRAKYMSHQMIQGVKQWFSANWPKLLAGAIAALAAFVGLNILTGGAITAALPAIMQVVGAVMGGVALANIAGHVGDYLSKGWAGDIAGGAKSLARGLAAGAVELVFALAFNAGALIKAVKGGLKGTAKAAKGAVKNTVKTTVKSVKELGQISAKGAKTAFKNGKIMLQGVKGGFAKGAKSLDDLAKQLVGKLRFNKFKIRRQGLRIKILGHINPWVLLADGTIKEVSFEGQGRKKIGDVAKHNGDDAIVVGIKNVPSKDVEGLREALSRLQETVKGQGGSQQFLYLQEVLGSKGLKNLATKTDDEILATFKVAEVAKQNPDLRQLFVERPTLFEKLAKNPEAVQRLEKALDYLRKEGAENLANAGSKTPTDTPLTPNQRQISEDIASTTPPQKPTQPGYDPKLSRDEYLDELYRQAEEADKELRPLTEKLAEITKGKPGFRKGLKGRERAMDKVLEYEKEGENASRLVDIAGSKIVFNSLDELYTGLDQIRRELESLRTINFAQIKDRFIKPQGSGYRDILMNLSMTNKHIVEFRLHLKQFDEVAAIEHDLYDVIRTMDTLAQQANRTLTTQEIAIDKAIKRQTQQMYDDALKRALGENSR